MKLAAYTSCRGRLVMRYRSNWELTVTMQTPVAAAKFYIGFTGARKGIKPEQVAAIQAEIRERVAARPAMQFFGRHGDTIGGDRSRFTKSAASRISR